MRCFLLCYHSILLCSCIRLFCILPCVAHICGIVPLPVCSIYELLALQSLPSKEQYISPLLLLTIHLCLITDHIIKSIIAEHIMCHENLLWFLNGGTIWTNCRVASNLKTKNERWRKGRKLSKKQQQNVTSITELAVVCLIKRYTGCKQ